MQTYFNIRYEFDRSEVHRAIARKIQSGESGYICVADGVIVTAVQRHVRHLRQRFRAALPAMDLWQAL